MKNLVKKSNNVEIYRMSSRGDERNFYADMGWVFASRDIRKELDDYPIDNDDDRRWLVAFKGDEVVAFRSYYFKDDVGRFADAWVSPPLRRQHVYSTLIKLAIHDMASAGVKRITAVANERSRPGLEKAGFTMTKLRGKKFFDMEMIVGEKGGDSDE